MAILVYRTSGRKIKKVLTTKEKVLSAIGLRPQEVKKELKWQQLKMQVSQLNQTR